MKNERIRKITPSELYRMKRPEYFSDSEITYSVKLTREQLSFELDKLSSNQKQDEFETLCRRLAEKFISPNLIPQVGPTGGGDGKTDSETYPVSDTILTKWYIPENGWEKGEKWAFAFSAKKDWKSKVKDDVKKIIGTKRGYTKIFFISNQLISSKKKKDTQDELNKEYGIEVVILDAEWILEKVYSNNLIDMVVDTLNLSSELKDKRIVIGKNDADRIKRLDELENNINNPKRYLEYDYLLVEDALEAAILSRMLEKSRDEVEGKFDRVYRILKKVNNRKQLVRYHYQRGWTYINWYDDYSSFIEEYNNLKAYISANSDIQEIELFYNLFNLLRGLEVSGNYELSKSQITIQDEKEFLFNLLDEIENNKQRPVSSLIAKTYKEFQYLMDTISSKQDPCEHFKKLSEYFLESEGFLDYPFDSFKTIVEELGNIFHDSIEFDKLIDAIASISEKRNSELTAGEIFIKRGGQKLANSNYKESIIYFGKAVLKLAKEESRHGMYLALVGLSRAYASLGLMWASNNALISASSIAFKEWYTKGILTKYIQYCVRELANNELIIGRIPNFLVWDELLSIINIQLGDDNQEIPTLDFLDALLSVRILNTHKQDNEFKFLPDILKKQSLWLSQNATLYKLGYVDLIISDYQSISVNNEKELDDYFTMVANQPFVAQMLYQTNFMSGEIIRLTSIILGCEFSITFEKDYELLFGAETLLALLESFLATSLTNIVPNTEEIHIELIKSNEDNVTFSIKNSASNEYIFKLANFDFSNREKKDEFWKTFLEFIATLLSRNFFFENPKEYIENLFKNEEVHERTTLIIEHRNFLQNILGKDYKLFYNDWIKEPLKEYPLIRKIPASFKHKDFIKKGKTENEIAFENAAHNKRKVFSVIDTNLWDKAKWKGFGFFGNNDEFGIFIGFENEEYGKKIFENWIDRFGKEDEDEAIKITIIKGINKNNPYWYRVHISSNIKYDDKSEIFFVIASRIHEMNANNPNNLVNLIRGYNYFKKYLLCPAIVDTNGKVKLLRDKCILKKELHIREAWQIGINDLDSAVIKKDDNPIIPDKEKNAPILELLKKKNE